MILNMEEQSTPGMMSGTGHRVYSTYEARLREEIKYLRKRLELAERLVLTFSEYAYKRYHKDTYREWKELKSLEP